MFSAPNPFVQRPPEVPKGTLIIKPQSANIDGDVGTAGKLNVFCKLHLGRGLLESVVDKKNDRRPVWTQELSFRRENESDLIINLYTKNLILAPSYLCECRINLTGVFTNFEVIVTPDLMRKGVKIGIMRIAIRWEPDQVYSIVQPAQPRQPNQYTFAPQMYSPSNAMQPLPVMGSGSNVYFQQGRSFAPQQVYVIRSSNQNYQGGPYPQQPQQPSYIPNPNVQNLPNQSVQQPPKKQVVEELADADLPEEQKCVICLDRKKAGAFYKCGHNCCCLTCGTGFIGKTCPICREPVLDFIKVFDA